MTTVEAGAETWPKVFLVGPAAQRISAAWNARATQVCLDHGLQGLHAESAEGAVAAAQSKFASDRLLLWRADAVIADLTPFRGRATDGAVYWQCGFAEALDKPVFGWSGSPDDAAADDGGRGDVTARDDVANASLLIASLAAPVAPSLEAAVRACRAWFNGQFA
ncbi:MAG: nucleoside 2-deoxyribosyltransferase [Alphaproteobacteria bacterium]|jgi:nucleoside 2-deoxyribosyltransferase|nr:nucleoside 2-deoxyribosyltransferase [Alphaproteobacteria bacterium]MDP6567860.1 nucleoside 2-deoxyribosyltransferase [Alphaproteobacteria bacterium]MDP6815740.1 nucleoside 2-deoxyribosyltransferase [Alphaproteobacteria bacterium]